MTTQLNAQLLSPPVLFPPFNNSHMSNPQLVQIDHDSCELILIYLASSIFTTLDYTSYKNACLINKTWNNFFTEINNRLWNEFPLYPILRIDTLYASIVGIKPEIVQNEASKDIKIRQLIVAELLGKLWGEVILTDPRREFRHRFEAGAELHFVLHFYSEKHQERLEPLAKIFNFFLNKLREDTQCAYLIAKERSREQNSHSHLLFIVQRLYSRFKKLETQTPPLHPSIRDILRSNPIQTLLVMRGFAQDRQTLLDNCYIPYDPNETLWNNPLPSVIGCLIQWETLEHFKLSNSTKDLKPEEISYLKIKGVKRYLFSNPTCTTSFQNALKSFHLPDNTADLQQDDIAYLQIKRLEDFFRHQLACEIPVSILPFIIHNEALSLAAQLTDYFISKGKNPALVVGMLRESLSLSIPKNIRKFTKPLLDFIIEKSKALNLIDSTVFTGITLLGMLCEHREEFLVARFLNTLKNHQHPFNVNLGEEADDLNTPLHYAVDSPSIWSQLLTAGADGNLANAQGETPYLNYLSKTKALDAWHTQLPLISFQPIQGNGLVALRKNLKELLSLGKYKPNFSTKFTDILKKILNETPEFLNEDTYTSLFFASVIFCFDHPLVTAEIEAFKNDIVINDNETVESSEFHYVSGFADHRHIPFLREWLECAKKKPISWLTAANAIWKDDCFKGVAETIKNSIFNDIYSKCKSGKYSLKEIRPLILILNDSRVNLFKEELSKIIKKTNDQKEDLVSWLAKHTKKPLNVSLIQTLMSQKAKLDVPKVISYMGPSFIRRDLLNFLFSHLNTNKVTTKELSILEQALQKWLITYREIRAPEEKRELRANSVLLENKISEIQAKMSPKKTQLKGKEAATPSPLKRTKTNTPPDSLHRGEKRKSSSTELTGVKRRLVFSTPPFKEKEEASSPSSVSAEALADLQGLDDLFREFHNTMEESNSNDDTGN